MLIFIIIFVVVIILYFLFFNKKKKVNLNIVDDVIEDDFQNTKSENLDNINILNDENGDYRLVEVSKEIPRRTYIKAILKGKYYGSIDEKYTNQFKQSKYFDFNIYEVSLQNAVYASVPFVLDEDLKIPREKIPRFLPTILEKDENMYELNLFEPSFSDIKFDRKLHQDEGNEVFGSVEAIVTGYILDFVTEVTTKKVYNLSKSDISDPRKLNELVIQKTLSPTGNIEYQRNYKRVEYYYSDYKTTYWSDWKYDQNKTKNDGCFSTIFGFLAGILVLAFILLLLPRLLFILPFILLLFLLNLLPSKLFSWIFQLFGLILLILFLVGLFQFFANISNTYKPRTVQPESPEEQRLVIEKVVDSLGNKNDTLIKHFRAWKDYNGKEYSGTIWVRKSDLSNSERYKNNLLLNINNNRTYDEMIFKLKEYDKNNLAGIYTLFDSINLQSNLSKVQFAELIVSFIQDIPYSVVVPNDCNPNLYDDIFIKQYLSSNEARCDGFEKFGINTPLEFMASLNGDCDTRTLLLYTMLSHYEYDVALFSSEYYSHSIIGINLPLNGVSYPYQNQHYILWETTAPNIKPGVLPKEISNLNYWRISLKSK